MKKSLLLTAALLLAPALAVAQDASSYIFKYQMHQLFDNFNHAQISLSLKKYEIAEIYLKYIIENIDEVGKYIPERKKDGTPLDREKFIQRLIELNKKVVDLRGAIEKGDMKGVKRLPQDIFNTCAACHGDVRLKYLFRHPGHTTVFSEDMHMVSKHMDLARIHAEEGGKAEDIEENLKLVGYYLDLLEGIFPETGPTGVIMDRENFMRRLQEVKGLNQEMLKRLGEKKPADIEALRKTMNGLCVACHEPERLK